MKKKLVQMSIFAIVAVTALALALADATAETPWKSGVNPSTYTNNICEAKEGACTSGAVPSLPSCYCRVKPKLCNSEIINNDYYTCLDGGAGGLFGSCKITSTRGWGRCIDWSGKSCIQYEKFYCVEVGVFDNSDCSGVPVCSYQLARTGTCDPMAP